MPGDAEQESCSTITLGAGGVGGAVLQLLLPASEGLAGGGGV